MEFTSYIIRTAQFSSLIPVVIGIARYKSLPKAGKLFFYFMAFSVCTEVIAAVLGALYNNSMPFMYVFTLVEFGVFCFILLPRLVLFSDRFKQAYTGLLLLMLVLLIADVSVHSLFKLNTISKIAECILIVFMGLAFLLQYIQSESNVKITRDYVFWIASGAVLYFAIAFFFFTTHTALVAINYKLGILFGISHLLASILANVLFAISFWVMPRKLEM